MFLAVLLTLFVLGDGLYVTYVSGVLRGPGVRGTRLMTAGIFATTSFFLVVTGGLVLALAIRIAGAPHVLPVPVMIAVYVWHLLVLPTFILGGTVASLIQVAVRGICHIAFRRPAARTSTEVARGGEVSGTAPRNMSRRRLLAGGVSLAPAVVIGAATGLAIPGLSHFAIRMRDIPIPGLPRDLDGLTIAHLSDTHLGDFSPIPLYRRMIDATNALRCDMIVHTGDVINVDADDLPEAMAGLRKLDAPLGVFACEGNHDLIQSPRKFWNAMRALPNVRFLRNDAATITARGVPIQLLGARWGTANDKSAGTDEYAAACADLEGAVQSGAFPILLAHHPHHFDHAPWAKLTLSGHTHGGQVMLTRSFGPGPLMYRYWSGTYRKPDRTLVVSNGAGNWFPIRTPAAEAEIVKLTLRAV